MVSHLFFADDSIFFFKAEHSQALNLKEALQLYATAAGQLINFDKSLICFSKNVPHEVRRVICGTLLVNEHDNLGFYLGLPTAIGRNKAEVFQFVKDKFWKRLNSWKHKALSRVGKEVLVKSVLQSLPSYVMNLFLLTQGICDDLQKMMARFWWGSKADGSRKIHWLSWDRLARHKHFGGLSFRRIRQFNVAMLGKLGWHLFVNSSSLASQILRARYFPDSSFLEAPLGTNPSYVWRSIRESQDLIRNGLSWRVGNGKDISIWIDNWLPDCELPTVTTEFDFNFGVFMVSDLIVGGGGMWIWSKLFLIRETRI